MVKKSKSTLDILLVFGNVYTENRNCSIMRCLSYTYSTLRR